MLRRLILVLALLVGALAVTQGTSQAAPLGATAQAAVDPSLKADKAYYYRRVYYYPRYRYRRIYRPRVVYYYPRRRYRAVRYYRPAYYRPVRFYRPRYYW